MYERCQNGFPAKISDKGEWAFIPADAGADTLFVVFSPAFLLPGKFSHFRRTQPLHAHKLLFSDVDNSFYCDRLNSIFDTIDEFRRACAVDRIVFWGFSSGGYAALNCGLHYGVNCHTVALSSHLRLTRPRTRAFDMIESRLVEVNDIRGALERHPYPNIEMFFPCHSIRDWPHVEDAASLNAPNVKLHFVASDHGIESDMVRAGVIEGVMRKLVEGLAPEFGFLQLASPAEVEIVRLGLKIFENLEDGIVGEYEWPEDCDCRNNWWFDIKSRYFAAAGRLEEAITSICKAIRLNPDVGDHYVSFGHYMKELTKSEICEAFYVEAYRKGSRDPWLVDRLGLSLKEEEGDAFD